MIALARPFEIFIRLAAPLAFHSDARVVRKLLGFAATEAGSALDMLKAAELAEAPRMRKLFFRHAMDEARHAQMFRDAARALELELGASAGRSAYDLVHATRQNLYASLGPVRFVVFVFLAESQAAQQFRALGAHFADRDPLAALFDRIARDEGFHVGYTRKLLDEMRAEGRGAEVAEATARVRLRRAWDAWRRAGRVLGDVLTHGLLLGFYLVVVPLFALAQRALEPGDTHGWRAPARPCASLADARRQS